MGQKKRLLVLSRVPKNKLLRLEKPLKLTAGQLAWSGKSPREKQMIV
jgi:hypothetical protein